MTAPRSTYLGQYEHANAERIAEELEKAGIGWYYKQSGRLGQFLFAGDWGVRLFVEELRLDEAQQIAERVTAPD